jgi:hypothetical protein
MKPKLPFRLAGILFLLVSPFLSYCCDTWGLVSASRVTGNNCAATFTFNYVECSSNVFYYIQYSPDDVNYYIIGKVTANGTGSYTYTDNYAHPAALAAANVYYRAIYYNPGTGYTNYSPIATVNLLAVTSTCTDNNVTRCNGLPSLGISGAVAVCYGTPQSYTVSGTPPYPATWSLGYNGSFVTLSQNFSGATVSQINDGNNGYFTLNANEEGCDALSSNIYLGIAPAPTTISPAYGTAVKPNIIYDFTSPTANYWTATNGTITSGQGTTDVEIKVANMVGSSLTVTGAVQDPCGTSAHLIYQYPISNSGGGGTRFSPDSLAGSNTGFGFTNMPGVYPNPATNSVQVTVAAADYSKSYIKLYDLNGRILKTIIPSGQTTLVDMSQQSKGIYIMEIFDGKQRTIQKVVRL